MSGFGKIVAGYIFNDEMKSKMIKRMNKYFMIPAMLMIALIT